MTDAAGDASRHQFDRRQRRRDKVVLISLVELLTIVTFIAVGFAFVTQQDISIERRWRVQYQRELEQRQKLERELATANAKIAEQEQELAALWDAYLGTPLPPDAELRRSMLSDLRGRGFGMPYCAAPHDALLFRVETYGPTEGDEGFRVVPLWSPEEDAVARAVPGVADLVSAGRVSRTQFDSLAQRIREHADAQQPACRYLVIIAEQHESLRLYKDQMRFLQRLFRVRAS